MTRFACVLSLLAVSLTACTEGLGVPEDRTDRGRPQQQQDMATRADCDTLDANACRARTDCALSGCQQCYGEVATICYPADQPGPNCPALVCPPKTDDCKSHDSEASCNAAGCVAVFANSPVCACPTPGCCQHFSQCIDNPAQCSPTDSGGAPPPCVGISCAPNYVPIYEGGACPIGCAAAELCDPHADPADCRTTGCSAGKTCQVCWSDWICMDSNSAC